MKKHTFKELSEMAKNMGCKLHRSKGFKTVIHKNEFIPQDGYWVTYPTKYVKGGINEFYANTLEDIYRFLERRKKEADRYK